MNKLKQVVPVTGLIDLIQDYNAIGLNVTESRLAFVRFEAALLTYEQIPIEKLGLKEYYSGGMYCREATYPAGSVITGRIYKFDHIEMMISGDVTVISADGGGKRVYDKHTIIEAKAGKKQAYFAHQDTVWLTVNSVPEDLPLDQALDFISVVTYQEYYDFYDQVNKKDYDYFLNEIGLTYEAFNKRQTLVGEIMIELPDCEHLSSRRSSISGQGLFTNKQIKAGDIIGLGMSGSKRSIAGRYSNHALHANTKPLIINDTYYIRATKDIQAEDEITINYRDVYPFISKIGETVW